MIESEDESQPALLLQNKTCRWMALSSLTRQWMIDRPVRALICYQNSGVFIYYSDQTWSIIINLLQNRCLWEHWEICSCVFNIIAFKINYHKHSSDISAVFNLCVKIIVTRIFAWNQGNLTIRAAQLLYCKAIWFLSLSNGFPAHDTLQYGLVKLYEALEIQVLYVLFIPYVPQAPVLRYDQLNTRNL